MSSEASRLSKSDKFHTVMREFGRGQLRSSSGQRVTDRRQALAIAFSEARRRQRRRARGGE